MIPASAPAHRPHDAKLLVADTDGRITHHARTALASFLSRGDVLVANDAATLPASLSGVHVRTGRTVEVRLAGRTSLRPDDVRVFRALVFGEGDYHLRTEERPAPPPLLPGDALVLGPLRATLVRLEHPRLCALSFAGSLQSIWSGIATHGRPIQYAHLPEPLALWDTWTTIAAEPAAFEPPSAGFFLSWAFLASLDAIGVRFATLTHAAGISSTGDADLDRRLPFDEPYFIPARTSALIDEVHQHGGRVVAIGTSVVRALEDASDAAGHVRAGHGLATTRIGPGTRLRTVDAIVSGTHEAGTSHHELLRAFLDEPALADMDLALDVHAYRTHEFGDSVFIEASASRRCGTGTPQSHGRPYAPTVCAVHG